MSSKWITIKTLLLALLTLLVLPMSAQVDNEDLLDDKDSVQDDTAAVVLTVHHNDSLSWPKNVQEGIDELLRGEMFNTSQVGLLIWDLDADSAIYRYNDRQLLRPASTMKVITAITALDRLGGAHQFSTDLCYKGTIENNTLTGTIYCVGGFDPRFNSDDMRAFAESIHKMGVDTIRGKIIADKSMKDDKTYGEGWCWDDDNPVLSPLLAGRKEEFGERLQRKLRQNGITVTGTCSNGSMPSGAHTLYIKRTPLLEVMRRQLKRSDNLYSEAIFYQLAAEVAGRNTASARHGRQAVNAIISKVGRRPSAYYIADGSGLSLYNYVSPELEVDFLRYAYRHPEIYDNMLPCLPIAGVDGTLSKRMRKGAAHENVKAKTGTVTGVSSLAGYLTTANGHRICFSIINMGIRHSSSGRNFQDKVCQALCK